MHAHAAGWLALCTRWAPHVCSSMACDALHPAATPPQQTGPTRSLAQRTCARFVQAAESILLAGSFTCACRAPPSEQGPASEKPSEKRRLAHRRRWSTALGALHISFRLLQLHCLLLPATTTQYWIKRQSQVAQLNMAPYYKAWGWPVEAATEAALAALPVYQLPAYSPPSPPTPPPPPSPPAPPVAPSSIGAADYQALAAGVGTVATSERWKRGVVW